MWSHVVMMCVFLLQYKRVITVYFVSWSVAAAGGAAGGSGRTGGGPPGAAPQRIAPRLRVVAGARVGWLALVPGPLPTSFAMSGTAAGTRAAPTGRVSASAAVTTVHLGRDASEGPAPFGAGSKERAPDGEPAAAGGSTASKRRGREGPDMAAAELLRVAENRTDMVVAPLPGVLAPRARSTAQPAACAPCPRGRPRCRLTPLEPRAACCLVCVCVCVCAA